MEAPQEAVEYYNLPQGSKMRDLILSIRADESCHREVNHHFADLILDFLLCHHPEVNIKGRFQREDDL